MVNKQLHYSYKLTNISGSKGNQTMKFGQLIEYNLKNIIHKIRRRNCSQTFLQKLKFDHISRSIVESFIQFVFIVCQVEGYRSISKLSCRSLYFSSYKHFLKNKRDLELVFLSHAPHDFCRKIFLLLCSINEFALFGCLEFVRYCGTCVV